MIRKMAIGVMVAAAFVSLLVWQSDLDQLDQARYVHFGPSLLVFVMTALLMMLSAWKWRLVLSGLHSGEAGSRMDFFRVVLIGSTLGQVVPQDVAAAGARITYLRGTRSLPLERATYSVFLDRWLDLVALAAVVPASVLFLSGLLSLWAAIALALGAVAGLALLSLVWPAGTTIAFTRAFNLVSAISSRVLRRGKITSPVASQMQGTLDGVDVSLVLLLGFMRLLIIGARAWAAMLAVGVDLSFVQALLIVPVGQLALLVPITPGGLGIYDAGWYGLLSVQGVSAAGALLFVLMHRVLTALSLISLIAFVEIPLQFGRLVLKR